MKNKEKKRIDIVSRYFYPVAAGIENNIMKTYAPMVKRGFEVVVHTGKNTYTQKNILASDAKINKIKIKRYNWISFFGFWPQIDWKNTDIICLHNFDVMPHFLIMLYAGFLKLTNKKNFTLLVIPHGGYSPEWPLFGILARAIKWTYHRTLGVLLLNYAVDGVRAVAYWEKAEMKKAGVRGDKINVITNGIEAEAYIDIDKQVSDRIKKSVDELGDYIIQGGRIYEIKNQLTAIKALAQLESKTKLVLLGPCQDQDYKNKLDKIIKDLKLKDRVIFAGVIRGVDKYYYLKKAKLMVHMALWEGNCNFINEAWSQNLLCVVADSKGLNEQISDNKNGYLIEKYDHKKLADKIEYILNNINSEKHNDMRKINMKYVNDNSWEKVSLKVEKFYLKSLNK
jgi:glycosyltransferase involved in cell wall biosynthesis